MASFPSSTDQKFKLVKRKKSYHKNERNKNYKNNRNKNSCQKKILCQNMIKYKYCSYGDNCVYAHSLSEQNINYHRNIIYKLLSNNESLDKLDLIKDKKLYETLLQLTQVCEGCQNGICLGGYNCKNGAINKKYVICYHDLLNGNCEKKSNCLKIHLTDRGLIPYEKQCQKFLNKNILNLENSKLFAFSKKENILNEEEININTELINNIMDSNIADCNIADHHILEKINDDINKIKSDIDEGDEYIDEGDEYDDLFINEKNEYQKYIFTLKP